MSVKQRGVAKSKKDESMRPTKSGKKDDDSIKGGDKRNLSYDKERKVEVTGWIQDVSLEVPVHADVSQYPDGQRELEFSVGMRQQDTGTTVRSELRARALVHSEGVVLVLVEASYVCDISRDQLDDSLPHTMYNQLKPHLEMLLQMSGHTPPLPLSLRQIEA